MDPKEEWLLMAGVCEEAERYEEMVEAMKKVIFYGGNTLNSIERQMLASSYKNQINNVRDAYKKISVTQAKQQAGWERLKGEEKENKRKNVERCERYKKQLAEEMKNIIEDLCALIDSILLQNAQHTKASVHYLKMKSESYALLAGISTGEQRWEYTKQATKNFHDCSEMSSTLPPENPLRLFLAWKYSEFCYEILNEPQNAIQIAREAFDGALRNLEHLNDWDYKDACLALSILRDNYTLWTQECKSKRSKWQEKRSMEHFTIWSI
eukprot:Phypoly_transcript_06253.p1 GENE.Phypoly_transcript_06253~~Phypoly_transcript_06253.p1  ORF type:complete len:267 (+),score=53.86 Phypoly_transcript_06253:843-1643(+)